MKNLLDQERLRAYLAAEALRVAWKDPIIVKLQEHLYVVARGSERITKCDCGHEFGPAGANWKLGALVHDRDPKEIYPAATGPDSNWCVFREFYCPGCGAQLEVEAVPPGLPFVHSFEPDLEALE